MFKIASIALFIVLTAGGAQAASQSNRNGIWPVSPYAHSLEAPEAVYQQGHWTGAGSGNDAGIRDNLRRDPFSDRR
jgi:hypothetical protein